jgi:hypothetical protein
MSIIINLCAAGKDCWLCSKTEDSIKKGEIRDRVTSCLLEAFYYSGDESAADADEEDLEQETEISLNIFEDLAMDCFECDGSSAPIFSKIKFHLKQFCSKSEYLERIKEGGGSGLKRVMIDEKDISDRRN